MGVVRGSDVADEHSGLNDPTPKQEGGTRLDHGVRCHCSHTTKIILSLVLLRCVRTDKGTGDPASSTLLHQCTPDVLPNIVPDKNEGKKAATNELRKSPSDLGARPKGNDVSPMGTVVNKSLTVSELRIARLKGVSENNLANGGAVQVMLLE